MSEQTDSRCGLGESPRSTEKSSFLRDVMPASLMLVCGLVLLLAGTFLSSPQNGHYLVITKPGSSLAETLDLVSAADGGLVDIGIFQNMVVAASAGDDFAQRLQEAGAWWVLPVPEQLGCYSDTTRGVNS